METFHCPRCDLRFRFANELRDHLGHDHPGFHSQAGSVAADLLDACHCHHHHSAGGGAPSHSTPDTNAA
jgi:hypothetical protein